MSETIYQLIPKILAEIGPVGKTGKNQQQGYAFRKIDEVVAAIQPLFAKYGVFLVPEVLEQSFEQVRVGHKGTLQFHAVLKIRHTLYAEDGSSVQGITNGEATDSGDKAGNKAMSSALKYFLTETFSIPTIEKKDTEDGHPELSQRAVVTVEELKEKIKWLGDIGSFEAAMAKIKESRIVPIEAEAFIREFYDPTVTT